MKPAFCSWVVVLMVANSGCLPLPALPEAHDAGRSDGAVANEDQQDGLDGGTSATGRDGALSSDGGGAHGGADGGVTADGPSEPSGPPAAPWVNVTNNLTTLGAGGGEVSVVSAQPNTMRVIVGFGQKSGRPLFATDDGGATWYNLGTGTGSATINHGPSVIVYDPDHPATWWEDGIYGDGAFKTIDDGLTFTRVAESKHSDLLSIDFTDPDRKTILLGSHEMVQHLSLSRDGGATFTEIGPNLPADSNYSTWPLVIDAQNFLIGSCGGATGACGVFRSEDGGDSWSRASPEGPAGRPLWASDGTLYWPLLSDLGLIVSKDLGKTWTHAADGPVQLRYAASPLELPDGRVVTLGRDYLLSTDDAGKTWHKIGAPLPAPGANCGIYAIAYSPELKAFFITHNDCSGKILDDSVYRGDFDYETQ